MILSETKSVDDHQNYKLNLKMEDDLQKRNTDCVYFLASPLTCKKGMECEFRHSEMARLNPRDCWYWLSGTCLNPTCAFRHPPIEGRSENPAEQPVSQPPAPVVIKNNVPCYFYFNGYCNKGDNCPFLHSSQSSKSPSSLTTTTTTTTLETSKTFATTQGVLESTEQSCLNNEVEITPQVLLSLPPSPQVSLVPEIVKSEVTLLPEIERSEEHLEIDPEERWESSPGFDVLVDDGSEQIGEDGMLPQHYGSYDSLVFLEPGVYDEHLEVDQMSDHARREIYPKKRQHSSRDVDFNGADLRNHLQKRRRITSRPRDGRDHERQYGRVRGRLASEVTSDRMVSRSESESDSLRRGRRSQHRHNSSSRSKHKDREKRRRARPNPIFSDDKIRSRQDGQCNQEHGISFTGPKTLAQIKEEKRKKAREENADSHLNGNLKERSGRRDDVFDDPENDDNDLGFNDVDDLIC